MPLEMSELVWNITSLTPFTSVFTVNPAPPSNGAGFALFPPRQPLVASFSGKSKSRRTSTS